MQSGADRRVQRDRQLRIARVGHQAGEVQGRRRCDDLAGVVVRLAIQRRFEFRERAKAFLIQFIDQRIAAGMFGDGISFDAGARLCRGPIVGPEHERVGAIRKPQTGHGPKHLLRLVRVDQLQQFGASERFHLGGIIAERPNRGTNDGCIDGRPRSWILLPNELFAKQFESRYEVRGIIGIVPDIGDGSDLVQQPQAAFDRHR